LGIEPATFQLVAYCLNQLRYRVPPTLITTKYFLPIYVNVSQMASFLYLPTHISVAPDRYDINECGHLTLPISPPLYKSRSASKALRGNDGSFISSSCRNTTRWTTFVNARWKHCTLLMWEMTEMWLFSFADNKYVKSYDSPQEGTMVIQKGHNEKVKLKSLCLIKHHIMMMHEGTTPYIFTCTQPNLLLSSVCHTHYLKHYWHTDLISKLEAASCCFHLVSNDGIVPADESLLTWCPWISAS